MPNKTIYVSDSDAALFEEAKQLAGTALSSVIVIALREYIYKYQERNKSMKEITIKVGLKGAERQQKFIGREVSKWEGFSDDGEMWLESYVYITQKNNLAVNLKTICNAKLVTQPSAGWRDMRASMVTQKSELFVADTAEGFSGKLPTELILKVKDLAAKEVAPVETLDI